MTPSRARRELVEIVAFAVASGAAAGALAWALASVADEPRPAPCEPVALPIGSTCPDDRQDPRVSRNMPALVVCVCP